MGEVRVFLADDHAVVRGGLKALIDAQPGMVVVGEAADGLETCALVATLQPDVVVTDVSMPGLTGSLATERLRRECPAVIAARLDLSIKTVETYRARAMEKLGLHSRAELVRYAVQQGWLQDS